MKIATIVGARPQFIKAAVVARALKSHRPDVKELLIHTGQHYDASMSGVFFRELEIPDPDYNLGVGGGTHGQNTGRMIEKIEQVLLLEKPSWVIVYGDTDSTLAGAIAAAKLHIPIAHVEAGLRSFNRMMPEEINRILTDHSSDILFSPSDVATANLRSEGIAAQNVKQVGDVMYDAAMYYGARENYDRSILNSLGMEKGKYILLTVHRQENTDALERLREIVSGLSGADEQIVWPIHPRARDRLKSFGIALPGNVAAIEPVGYLDMVTLEKNARLIATDSGGVQKEAYFHGVPCLVLRTETEWVELTEFGTVVLGEFSASNISGRLNCVRTMPLSSSKLYGGGTAGRAIAESMPTS